MRFAAHEALTTEAIWLDLAAHLPDDEETRAARAMLDYAAGPASAEAPDTEPDGNLTSTGQQLVAALLTAESDLRTVRLALEDAFNDDSETTP